MRFITWVDARTRFAEWGPDSNPLIVHLKRQPVRLSLRGLLWLTFGVGLMATLGLTWSALTGTASQFSFGEGMVIVLGAGLFVLMPFLSVGWAIILTRRAIMPVRYEVILTTPLANGALVWAHVFAVLYRLRYLAATMVVLLPVIALETFRLTMVLNAQFHTYVSVAPAYQDIVGPSLMVLLGLICLMGLALLGVAIGVRVALLGTRTRPALVSSLFLVGMFVCPCGGCVIAPSLVLPSAFEGSSIMFGLLGLIMAALPYLFTIGVMHSTSAHWDR